MEIKIQLPNPDDYQYANGVTDWFSQMRISLKAAEKTYQEATKDLIIEEGNNVVYFVDISIPYGLEEARYIGKEYPPDGISEILKSNLYLRVWSV